MTRPFYTYLAYVVIGIAILTIVPDKLRSILIAILLLGGIYYVQTHGGLNDFWNQLTGPAAGSVTTSAATEA